MLEALRPDEWITTNKIAATISMDRRVTTRALEDWLAVGIADRRIMDYAGVVPGADDMEGHDTRAREWRLASERADRVAVILGR